MDAEPLYCFHPSIQDISSISFFVKQTVRFSSLRNTILIQLLIHTTKILILNIDIRGSLEPSYDLG